MINDDDGFIIQNGNLVNDGVIVANGAAFETGILLEDGRQVKNSAESVSNGNGEDGVMILDDKIHIAAGDTVVDRERMLWQR